MEAGIFEVPAAFLRVALEFTDPSADLPAPKPSPCLHKSFKTVDMPLKQPQLPENKLPTLARYITDHDPTGLAIFSDKFDEILPRQELAHGARFSLGCTSHTTPVNMTDDKDLANYQSDLDGKPGIKIPGGTVLRVVDMQPGAISRMHRIVSLDYGVVIEGEVELLLDSGEVRLMRRGDLAVQGGTNHAWRNISTTNWARMMYVLR